MRGVEMNKELLKRLEKLERERKDKEHSVLILYEGDPEPDNKDDYSLVVRFVDA